MIIKFNGCILLLRGDLGYVTYNFNDADIYS